MRIQRASQPANHFKSPKWRPGVKTLKAFAIWPYSIVLEGLIWEPNSWMD